MLLPGELGLPDRILDRLLHRIQPMVEDCDGGARPRVCFPNVPPVPVDQTFGDSRMFKATGHAFELHAGIELCGEIMGYGPPAASEQQEADKPLDKKGRGVTAPIQVARVRGESLGACACGTFWHLPAAGL